MQFTVETEQEVDGRWIAEVAEIPGAMKYGKSKAEAIALAEALAHERRDVRLRAATSLGEVPALAPAATSSATGSGRRS